MRRGGARLWGATALGAALLAALAPRARGALPPAYGGELRLPAPAPLRAPDPTRSRGAFDASLAAATFDTLYRLDAAGEAVPLLAAGPPEHDGERVEIPLRSDIRRHDGHLLEPRHVVRSLERAAEGPAGWLLAGIAREGGDIDVEATDDGLSLRLEREALDVARLLSAAPLAIVARASARRPVGTGPFIARRVRDALVLREFRHAARAAPYVQQIRVDAPVERERELRGFELERLDASWRGTSLYGGSPSRPTTSTRWPEGHPVMLVRDRHGGSLSRDATWGAFAAAVDRRRLARVGIAPGEELADGLQPPAPAEGRGPEGRVTVRVLAARGDALEQRLVEALAGIVDDDGFAVVATPRAQTADLRIVTVVPPLPGDAARVAAALAAAGERDRARALAAGGFDAASAETAVRRLDGLVVGRRRRVLHHRADLLALDFDPLGRLRLGAMHLARGPRGGMP